MPTSLNVPADQSLLGTWGPVLNENWTALNDWFYTGAIRDASQFADVQAAIDDLPGAGGVVDARSPGVNLVLGDIDPGTMSVTLLLGPYTYTVNQITLRTNFHIIGSGTGEGLSSSKPPTVLQAIGSNSTYPFVLSQTVNEGQEDIILKGFRLLGSVANTSQQGISLVAPDHGGLWYSEFDDLEIFGFAGVALNFSSPTPPPNDGIHQFSNFNRIFAARTNGGDPCLQIEGFCNSLVFSNCEFDGFAPAAGGDGLTNIKIIDSAGGTFPPYNIMFKMLTCQWAGVGVQINGADAVSIDQGHFEGVSGVCAIGTGASFGSLNITIHDSFFGNGSGIDGGNGYIVNMQAASVNASAAIIDSHTIAASDAFLKGNTAAIVEFGNIEGPEGSYVYRPPQLGPPKTFGAGSAGTAVTTTTKGGGTGPTTPQTIVGYRAEMIAGVLYYIPLMQ